MLMTTRKPVTVAEILVEEFMEPMGLTQAALAEAMGVQRKHVNELCNDRRNVTAADGAHSRPRVRQQSRLLAERAATQRFMGSDAFAARAQADRTGEAVEGRRVMRAGATLMRPTMAASATAPPRSSPMS